MTPEEEFTKSLPLLTNEPLPIKPPFEFKGLSARIFPLRANLDTLQEFCNDLLNFVPAEVGSFRAQVPYVYLAMLDYSKISEQLNSLGWFAQVEVFFCVPVEWYKVVNGRWVFYDWAVITPFIYVNDELSVPMGRAVYGFPKTLARVTATTSQWLTDPVSPVTLARVETAVIPELFQGKVLETRVFLEVERNAPMSNFRIPADPQSPIAPWVVASNFAQAMAGFGRDAMWLGQSMRIFQTNPGTDPIFGAQMLERMLPGFAPGGTGFVLNSLNLKQLRLSNEPSRICYQALTNGRMQMAVFNGGGLLGEELTFLGDLSGGYTIKLHEYPSLLIARTLGLEVHQRWRGDGVDVASLKPVMPFWLNVNVKYQQGMNLVWRTHNGIWRSGSGETLDPSQKPAKPDDLPLFNTTAGSVVDAVAGPFQFKGTTIRVLPLLADREKLEKFLRKSVNDALGEHFQLSLWARPPVQVEKGGPAIGGDCAYVYMTVTSLGEVTSKTNNVGDWAKYEVSFLIPVKWQRKSEGKNDDWSLEGVGLVPAYTFVDNTTAAISRSEVLGIPTSRAEFVKPESVWMREGEEDVGARQTLLRVEAEVIPALRVGQQTAMHPLIEISERDFAGIGDPDSRVNPIDWAEILLSELETKKDTKAEFREECNIARALALELLGNRVPVSFYTLKQLRDVADPGKACYQSLVRVSRVLEEVIDVREIEQTIRVRIHDFPTLKLVESLGIVAKTVREDGSGIIYGTQAIRPFSIRATIDESLGERLLSRAGTVKWELGDHASHSRLSDDAPTSDDVPRIMVDLQAEREQDLGDPRQMNSVMTQSAKRRRKDGKEHTPESEFTKNARQRLWESELRSRKAEEAENKDLEEQKRAWEEKLPSKKQAAQLVQGMTKTAVKEALENEGPESERRMDLEVLLEVLREREEWRLRQGITKAAAREALKVVDPQMVIESILSREWGNFDKNARWRVGRYKLHNAREIGLSSGSGGSFAFGARNILTPANSTLHDAIKSAIAAGRSDFANVEALLYNAISEEKAHRPGSPRLDRDQDVTEMIERMKKFTTLRLEIEDRFSVLAAWSISRWSQVTFDQAFSETTIPEVSKELVDAMRKIADQDVIGEPSKDSNTLVLNDWIRLNELLMSLEKETRDSSTVDSQKALEKQTLANPALAQRQRMTMRGFRNETVRFQDEGATEDAWRLIDQYREAVHLARKYCDVQRDALINKLSRAYQKPDFCIRRDSVDRARDELFPLTLSWDEHWYYGENREKP